MKYYIVGLQVPPTQIEGDTMDEVLTKFETSFDWGYQHEARVDISDGKGNCFTFLAKRPKPLERIK